MARKSYQIKGDGRDYNFTPGKNGSLTAKSITRDSSMLNPIPEKRAKAVPNPFTPRNAKIPVIDPATRKKRFGIAKSISLYE